MITNIEKIYNPMTNEFDNYKMVKNGKTFQVPLDPANKDYQAIQEWIANGGTVIDNPPE